MKSVEESVVIAMDGADKELFTYLPYILQDVWEIGSDPEIIIEIIKKHIINDHSNLKILDLGCGKGAVSIKVAEQFGCHCHGIDAISEFIDCANKKAVEYNVNNLCLFEVADIREKIKTLKEYDIVILGSIGPVFGNHYTTLSLINKHLKPNGLIILDDGYIDDGSSYTHPLIQKQGAILKQIQSAGMMLSDEMVINKDDISEADDDIFNKLKNRCMELISKYPEKRQLFEDYIQKQIEENEVLENKIICSAMVIKKIT